MKYLKRISLYLIIIIIGLFIVLGTPILLNYFNLTNYWDNYFSSILSAFITLLGVLLGNKLSNKMTYTQLIQIVTKCLSDSYKLDLLVRNNQNNLNRLNSRRFYSFVSADSRNDKVKINKFKNEWKYIKVNDLSNLSYKLTSLNVDFDLLQVIKINIPRSRKYITDLKKCKNSFNVHLTCAIPSDIDRILNGYEFDDVIYMMGYIRRIYMDLGRIDYCIGVIQKECRQILYNVNIK